MDEKEAVIFFYFRQCHLIHHVTFIYINTQTPIDAIPIPFTLYWQVTMETGSVSTSSTVIPHFLIVFGCLHPSTLLLSSIRVLASLLPAPTATAKMSIN